MKLCWMLSSLSTVYFSLGQTLAIWTGNDLSNLLLIFSGFHLRKGIYAKRKLRTICSVNPPFLQEACWIAGLLQPLPPVFYYSLFQPFEGWVQLIRISCTFSVLAFELSHDCVPSLWSKLPSFAAVCCSAERAPLHPGVSVTFWYRRHVAHCPCSVVSVHYHLFANFLWKTPFRNDINVCKYYGDFAVPKPAESPALWRHKMSVPLVTVLWQCSRQPCFRLLLSAGSWALSALGQGLRVLLVLVRCAHCFEGEAAAAWSAGLHPSAFPDLEELSNLRTSNPLL